MRRGERERERRRRPDDDDDDDEEDDDERDRDDEGLRRRRYRGERERPPRRRPRDRLRPRFANNSSSRSAAAIASELIWGLRFCVFVAATDVGGATTGAGAGAWKRLGFGRLAVVAAGGAPIGCRGIDFDGGVMPNGGAPIGASTPPVTGAGATGAWRHPRASTIESCPPGQFIC